MSQKGRKECHRGSLEKHREVRHDHEIQIKTQVMELLKLIKLMALQGRFFIIIITGPNNSQGKQMFCQ